MRRSIENVFLPVCLSKKNVHLRKYTFKKIFSVTDAAEEAMDTSSSADVVDASSSTVVTTVSSDSDAVVTLSSASAADAAAAAAAGKTIVIANLVKITLIKSALDLL